MINHMINVIMLKCMNNRHKTIQKANISTSPMKRRADILIIVVPETGLEPVRHYALPPQGSVSTNFTTRAQGLNFMAFLIAYNA